MNKHVAFAHLPVHLACYRSRTDEREPTHNQDRYIVAVKKDKIAIKHLSRKVSHVC